MSKSAMTIPESVELVREALVACMNAHGLNDDTYIAPEDQEVMARAAVAALEAHTSHNAVELVEDFAAAFDDWLSEISGYGIEALFCSPEWSRVEQTRAALAGQQ
jgi:hypothetical protein